MTYCWRRTCSAIVVAVDEDKMVLLPLIPLDVKASWREKAEVDGITSRIGQYMGRKNDTKNDTNDKEEDIEDRIVGDKNTILNLDYCDILKRG